jgi:hypothetical protein
LTSFPGSQIDLELGMPGVDEKDIGVPSLKTSPEYHQTGVVSSILDRGFYRPRVVMPFAMTSPTALFAMTEFKPQQDVDGDRGHVYQVTRHVRDEPDPVPSQVVMNQIAVGIPRQRAGHDPRPARMNAGDTSPQR